MSSIIKACFIKSLNTLFYFDYLTSVRNGSFFLGVAGKLRPKTRKTKTRKAKTRTTKSNQCDFPFLVSGKFHMSQVRTRFGLFSLLYARCLARFEAISARFSDFPAPDINSKGQRSYCATRSYFLLAALLHVQKLRPAKRVIMAPLLLLPSQITDFHLAKYRFLFRELQISQNTYFHFVSFRFVSFRKLQ